MFLLQLVVEAFDSAYPQDVTSATVTVNVLRNQGRPSLIGSPYITTVNETIPVGTSVLTVQASDPDGVRTRHSV